MYYWAAEHEQDSSSPLSSLWNDKYSLCVEKFGGRDDSPLLIRWSLRWRVRAGSCSAAQTLLERPGGSWEGSCRVLTDFLVHFTCTKDVNLLYRFFSIFFAFFSLVQITPGRFLKFFFVSAPWENSNDEIFTETVHLILSYEHISIFYWGKGLDGLMWMLLTLLFQCH